MEARSALGTYERYDIHCYNPATCPANLRLQPAQRAERTSRFALARPNDTSSNRKLPYVTHRVFCAMHEATDDCRRELGPSHAAKVAECCDIDRAKLRNSHVNSCG